MFAKEGRLHKGTERRTSSTYDKTTWWWRTKARGEFACKVSRNEERSVRNAVGEKTRPSGEVHGIIEAGDTCES